MGHRYEVGKKYKDGFGDVIEIIKTDAPLPRPLIGRDDKWNVTEYLPNGSYSEDFPHPADLIEEVPAPPTGAQTTEG